MDLFDNLQYEYYVRTETMVVHYYLMILSPRFRLIAGVWCP
jgi:hypothetical protein